jgi:glucose 1-dehydrogenase
MRAVTVEPGRQGTLAVAEFPEPTIDDGELLVDGLAIGVCGTDKEIVAGQYGWPPEESASLVLGHESLGRIRESPPSSGFAAGDLVVGVVRRPDPVPCGACAHGEFDMCRNGRYRERGIKQLHGYGSERWVVAQDYAVRLDPTLEHVGVLVEPASVVAKAWEQIDRVGERSWFEPQRLLVTGAGSIGLLAALIGVQRDLDVHVLDRVTDGPKPSLVRGLGATYHDRDIDSVAKELQPDVVIEATGAGSVVFGVLQHTSHYGVTCLVGVSPAGRHITVDAAAVNREIVLENDVVIGSVNANLRHYRQAADILVRANAGWLAEMITRRVPLDKATQAFDADEGDVKVVIDVDGKH